MVGCSFEIGLTCFLGPIARLTILMSSGLHFQVHWIEVNISVLAQPSTSIKQRNDVDGQHRKHAGRCSARSRVCLLQAPERRSQLDANRWYSVYSAYEHSLLPSTPLPVPASSTLLHSLNPKINLPLDITLETLFSAFLLCVGVVLSSPGLKPIQWNVWAGQSERSKEAQEVKEVGVGGGNPYAGLEERSGFLDIRRSRKEFAEWVKQGDGGGKS